MRRKHPPGRSGNPFRYARICYRGLAASIAAFVLSSGSVNAEMNIYKDEDVELNVLARAGFGAFGTRKAFFGNARTVIGSEPNTWYEAFSEAGLTGKAAVLNGSVYGAFTAVYTGQRKEDPRGNNSNDDVNVEKAYLGWRYDQGIESIGIDSVDLSAGRQEYKIGKGFLIWDGTLRRRDNASFQFDPRQVWQLAGLARVEIGPLKAEGFYLDPDVDNDRKRMTVEAKGYGTNLEYNLGDYGSVGFTYGHVYGGNSMPIRDGGNVFNARTELTPLKPLPGLSFYSEFAFEENGSRAQAIGYAMQPRYTFKDWPLSPSIAYRYAFLSGDDPETENKDEAFDPLAYGGSDWGTWFQGEIVGHYVLLNTNLKTHMARLDIKPLESVMAGVQYYKFEFDNAKSFGLTSSSFGQELDVDATWFIDKRFRITAVGAVVHPQQAAQQLTGSGNNWYMGKLFLNFQL
jgi:hypothetical protein